MWELDSAKDWVSKNWCVQTVVLEDTRSPLDFKDIKPVNSKGNQSGIFTGRMDAKAEALVFGHLMWRADSVERPWWWKRLKAGGEGDDKGWVGWMASRTQWTLVWAGSRRWWPGGRVRGRSWVQRGTRGHWGWWEVLYLDCGAGYTVIHVCWTSEL